MGVLDYGLFSILTLNQVNMDKVDDKSLSMG
jgi:hypothetical protein